MRCTVLFPLLLAATAVRADFIDHLATAADVGKMKGPHRGSPRVLVIPLVVDDEPFESGQGNAAGFEAELRAFYGPPGAGFGFQRYFAAASLGRFTPEVSVASPVHIPTCPQLGPYTGCAIPRNGISGGDILGSVQLLQDVLRFLDEILVCAQDGPGSGRSCTAGGGADLGEVDVEGPAGVPDGWVDGVLLVSNAPFGGIALPVRWLRDNPLLQFTYPPLPDFTYGSQQVGIVAIAGRSGAPRHAAYVSVHEYGHVLGLADLYNESGSTTDMPYSVMGDWGYDVAASLPDPFSRVVLGWAQLHQVTGPGTLVLPPAAETGKVYKLGTGREFFLLEYRTRGNLTDGDLTVPGGVVVQRVRLDQLPSPNEGSFLGTLANCVNCSAWDPMLLVEQADGRYDLQQSLPRADADDLYRENDALLPSTDTQPRGASHMVSSTNRLDGTPTGLSLTVESITATEARVRVDAPAVADGCAELGWLCRESTCTAGACGTLAGPPDAGHPDAHVADAAVPQDASVPVDAGSPRPDAAVSPDAAAVTPDAATTPDAAITPDAGIPGADGGAAADAGAAPPGEDGPGSGCACTAGDAGAGSFLLAAALATLTRRRHARA
ncbi:MAG: hypothetical protein HY904_22865 [Deltaproteobacteria bacterium]|nr:hypothetical protein [Deltaproteobacteria bacterium]